MTGIYQCFCQNNMVGGFTGPLHEQFKICKDYTYFALFGGHFASIPYGLFTGILNNIGAKIVVTLLPKFKFLTKQSES